MPLIRKDSLNKLKQINKLFNKSNNVTKGLKDYKYPNATSIDNPLDRKVDSYEDFVKNQKTKK